MRVFWKSSYSIRTYRTQSSTQNILDEFTQPDRKECKDAVLCYLTAANTGLKPEGQAADVPVTEPQVPQPDEGVVATGEQLSWRLKHHVQHTRSSTELRAKRSHTLGPGQGTGPARDIKECIYMYEQNGITLSSIQASREQSGSLLFKHWVDISDNIVCLDFIHTQSQRLEPEHTHTQWFNQLFYFFFLTTPTSKIKN